jgi:hypothetical protein
VKNAVTAEKTLVKKLDDVAEVKLAFVAKNVVAVAFTVFRLEIVPVAAVRLEIVVVASVDVPVTESVPVA